VIIVEGNWDARTPLDFIADKTKCQPIPTEDRSFYFKDLISSLNNKILYFDEVGTIKTENELFVLWPFDCAVVLTQIPELDDDEKTKKRILVSHAQIDWKSIKGKIPMTKEGEKIDENMKTVLKDLKAEIVVHAHLHDKNGIYTGYFYEKTFVEYLPKGTCRFIKF